MELTLPKRISRVQPIKVFLLKIKALLAVAGWRRVVFVAFCVAMIAAGARYLYEGARASSGGRWEEEIAIFRRCVVMAIVGFALLAIASRWLVTRGRLPELAASAKAKVSQHTLRWFLIGYVLFSIVAGVLWAQRFDASLWTDEVTTMRIYTVGRWRHYGDGEGQARMIRPSWGDTFFGYKTPNNHLAYSVAARLLHEKTVGVNETDFSRPYFNTFILRLPAFLAGLATISLVGYLALRLHSLLAAWLAMGYLTLHPWMLEFSTSVRGYTFAMAFLALAVVAAVEIFRRGGGWRWWVIYGLAQLLAFCSVLTVLHALALLNLALFLALLFGKSVPAPARKAHLGAFFATNIPCALLAIAAFKPKLPQFQHYLIGQRQEGFSLGWIIDCASGLVTGQPYANWEAGNPWVAATSHWPVALLALGILVASVCVGFAFLQARRQGLFAMGLALACVLPPLTTFIQSEAMRLYIFPWYAVWQLPLFLVLISCGAACAIGSATKKFKNRNAAIGAAALLLLLAGFATHGQRKALLSVSYEAQKESAAVMRPSSNPYAPDHDKIITAACITPNYAYDPWGIRLKNSEILLAQVAKAEATGHPFYCDTAWIENIPVQFPDVAKYLLDDRYFELEEKFYGLQPQNSRYVYRYRPGSLKAELEGHGSE